MNFIKLDVVDWEPATVTFRFSDCREEEIARIKPFVSDWFQRRPTVGVCTCTLNYAHFKALRSKTSVTVEVEWMCEKCLHLLVDDASRSFRDLKRVEFGLRVENCGPLQFVEIPEKIVELENGVRTPVRAFSIARHPVTVGEFKRFVDETGYVTSADQQKDTVNFLRHFGLAGFSESARMGTTACQLSFCDAVAYCDYAGYRLPTEVEWFAAAVIDPTERDLDPLQEIDLIDEPLRDGEIECSFVDITSTRWDGFVIARAGPYRFIKKGWRDERSLKNNRRILRPNEYSILTTCRLVKMAWTAIPQHW